MHKNIFLLLIQRMKKTMKKEILKSQVDTAEYEYVELSNGIKAIVASDPALDKCSCAVSVKVGSFSDPEYALGLAHFLEHMLFMGTEEYPGENEFDCFMNQNNGSFNAITWGEVTEYFFDISPDAFEEGVYRFADFFKAPLLRQDAVKREISAVNAEFVNGLNRDEWRIQRMIEVLCSDEEPLKKFSVGNYKTLDHDGIWDEAREFWTRHYSSEKICVVIYGNQSIEDMKRYLSKFEGVQRRTASEVSDGIQELSIKQEEKRSVFKSEYLNKWITIESFAEVRKVMVTITVPSGYKMFRKNSYGYVLGMLERSDERGFICGMKDLGLVLSIDVEVQDYSDYSLFVVSIFVSEEGTRKMKEVLEGFVRYLRGIEVNEEEYEELKRRNESVFRYSERQEMTEQVSNIVRSMQFYPIENVLNHEYCFEGFDEGEIRGVISKMCDVSQWLVFDINFDYDKISSENERKYKEREEIYGIGYEVGKQVFAESAYEISVARLDEIRMMAIDKDMRNEMKQVEKDGGKLLYLFDESYKVPKVFVGCVLKFEYERKDVLDFMFLVNKAKDVFLKKYGKLVYATDVSIDAHVCLGGIEIVAEGFTNVVKNAFEVFFNVLFEEASEGEGRNLMIMQEMMNVLEQERTKNPYALCMHGMMKMKVDGYMLPEEKMKMVKEIDVQKMIPRSFFADMVVVGNVKHEWAVNVFESVCLRQHGDCVNLKSKLMDLSRKCDVHTEDPASNACAIYLYGGKYADSKETAVINFVQHACKGMFFDQLRTKEELGYIVYCRMAYVEDEQYITFVVQSEREVEYLEGRVKKFIGDLNGYFAEMQDEEFEKFRSAVMMHFEERKKNFGLYGEGIWKSYLRGVSDLEYEKRVCEALMGVTKHDLSKIDWMADCYVVRVALQY
ncbi:insulinase-like Zn-dependent peptidase [Ordospora colligata OC4]|uniref:Insulinase-like Zn-dependent peptidase n=1 Tax=Ordospora colligata OC4 TaxID=1354746 RepID=A0A0B2UKM9_9MICR|nr:insulinase-like Zn-dependent peptidase [Ordospora colligata OC4]KHN69739.1 insulinase-like Zn-dependent peptidase [Ordospora colligata OC4]